jgi:Domain of unknown function (DUF6538)
MGGKAMPGNQYLTRRNGGIYYFRRRVPQHLVDVLQREHIVESLRTSDYRQARAKARQRAAEIDREFQTAGGTTATNSSLPRIEELTPDQIEEMVHRWSRLQLQRVANLAIALCGDEDGYGVVNDPDLDLVREVETLAAERTTLEWAPVGPTAQRLADRILGHVLINQIPESAKL